MRRLVVEEEEVRRRIMGDEVREIRGVWLCRVLLVIVKSVMERNRVKIYKEELIGFRDWLDVGGGEEEVLIIEIGDIVIL